MPDTPTTSTPDAAHTDPSDVVEGPTPPAPWFGWWPSDDAPNVHLCIARAMALVRPVGKDGRNQDQGYAFKRIDDFMTSANGALAAAGVHIVPRVLQRITDESHTTSGGRNVMRWVDLEVAFDFHGPAGDHVTVVTWGEGRDSSDKATNKALTGAMKYALMYALMVPTSDIQDADRDSPEAERQTEEQRAEADRQRRYAETIATATAPPDKVAELRDDVLLYADTLPDVEARRAQLGQVWKDAAAAGALGCTVAIPEPWQQFANGQTECTLNDLITGALGPNLPQSGESTEQPADDAQAGADAAADDPWATPAAGEGMAQS